MDIQEIIYQFVRHDLRGILITDKEGNTLYKDDRSALVDRQASNWRVACPPPEAGQRAVEWDLSDTVNEQAYMVLTSTMALGDELVQVHHLTDITVYTDIYKNISEYSRDLKHEKEHDAMTRLYNKGKFIEYTHSLFQDQESIAIYNMDLNFLKVTNDTLGHEAGDHLIKKAAASIHKVTSRNVLGFRVGGDEFVIVALHLTYEEALKLKDSWAKGLDELNQRDDSLPCNIACGMVYGTKGYDLNELLSLADRRMYEEKKRMKEAAI